MRDYSILPCPFCGATESENESGPHLEWEGRGGFADVFFVKCDVCGATGRRFSLSSVEWRSWLDKMAVDAWNQRYGGWQYGIPNDN